MPLFFCICEILKVSRLGWGLWNWNFPWPIFNLLHKDKTLLALRNNFRVTNKFLITNFDCIRMPHTKQKMKNFFQIKFLFFGLIDHNKSTAKIEIRQKNSLNLRYIHIRLHTLFSKRSRVIFLYIFTCRARDYVSKQKSVIVLSTMTRTLCTFMKLIYSEKATTFWKKNLTTY